MAQVQPLQLPQVSERVGERHKAVVVQPQLRQRVEEAWAPTTATTATLVVAVVLVVCVVADAHGRRDDLFLPSHLLLQ